MEHHSWWLTPSGELKPCPEHEYAAKEILHTLGVIPAPGRQVYDQMFDRHWVRVVLEGSCVHYETSRTQVQEANQNQLRTLKALAVTLRVGLYNVTAQRNDRHGWS
jgi:hypothetical protein